VMKDSKVSAEVAPQQSAIGPKTWLGSTGQGLVSAKSNSTRGWCQTCQAGAGITVLRGAGVKPTATSSSFCGHPAQGQHYYSAAEAEVRFVKAWSQSTGLSDTALRPSRCPVLPGSAFGLLDDSSRLFESSHKLPSSTHNLKLIGPWLKHSPGCPPFQNPGPCPGQPPASTAASQRSRPWSLGGGDGTDRGHESLHDAKAVEDDPGQAAGGAGGAADILRELPSFSRFSPSQTRQTGQRRCPCGPALKPSFRVSALTVPVTALGGVTRGHADDAVAKEGSLMVAASILPELKATRRPEAQSLRSPFAGAQEGPLLCRGEAEERLVTINSLTLHPQLPLRRHSLSVVEKGVHPITLERSIRPLVPLAMAAVLVRLLLLLGVLLPRWGDSLLSKQGFMKRPGDSGISPRKEGAECSHHSQCVSDCCLLNLDSGATFCAPKTRKAMPCLPQTKGAINIICPCQRGLNCISRDLNCPRRCYWM
ncbi:Colipase-like protein 2, partial [Galemys pyrenaicus]